MPLDFRAVLRAVVLRAAGLRAVDRRAVVLRAVVLRAVDRRDDEPDARRRVPLTAFSARFSASLIRLRAVFAADCRPLRSCGGSFLICFSMLSSVGP